MSDLADVDCITTNGTSNEETMSDTPTDKKLRDLILSERDKGNVVVWGLPGQLMHINLEDFVKQPADGILYDLNRLEEVALTFLDDPKWVNDFAVALTVRKLVDQRITLERDTARLRADASRYRWLKARLIENPVDELACGIVARDASEWDGAVDSAIAKAALREQS